jgi:hypothetical protein
MWELGGRRRRQVFFKNTSDLSCHHYSSSPFTVPSSPRRIHVCLHVWEITVSEFPMVSLTSCFRPHYGPGVHSASNRNEYQECFLRGECGRCVGLTTLPPSCADCLEIVEPQRPGTLTACTGIALPFYWLGMTCHFTNGTPSLLQETVRVWNKGETRMNVVLCCQLDRARSSCQT